MWKKVRWSSWRRASTLGCQVRPPSAEASRPLRPSRKWPISRRNHSRRTPDPTPLSPAGAQGQWASEGVCRCYCQSRTGSLHNPPNPMPSPSAWAPRHRLPSRMHDIGSDAEGRPLSKECWYPPQGNLSSASTAACTAAGRCLAAWAPPAELRGPQAVRCNPLGRWKLEPPLSDNAAADCLSIPGHQNQC